MQLNIYSSHQVILICFIFMQVCLPCIVKAEQTEETQLSLYAASGLSISNTGNATFGETSYPSVEFGFSKGALSLGLVVGRSNNDYTSEEILSNYWWEMKTALSIPVDSFTAYGLLGIGHYLSTDRLFIEYGVGVSHSWDQLALFAQVSNWDGFWYITPGLSYTF